MFATEIRRSIAAAIAAIAAGFILVTPGMPVLLTFPAAAALVLALPGYVLTLFLFGGHFDAAEQIALTIGLSLAVTIGSGLLLNLLEGGLTLGAWGGFLGGVTVLVAGLAAIRSALLPTRRSAGEEASASGMRPLEGAPATLATGNVPRTESTPRRLMRSEKLMIVAAVVLVVGAVGLSRLGEMAQPEVPFTQFWMLPNDSGTLAELGITNHEDAATTYRIVVRLDGQKVTEIPDISLAVGATWQQSISMDIDLKTPHSVTALLYRTTDTVPYREAHSTVNRAAATPAPLPSDEPSEPPPSEPAVTSP